MDHVKIIQPAALGDRQITNLIEICRNSQQFSTALEIVADSTYVITLNYRRRQLYIWAIMLDVLEVAVSKKIPSQAGEAAVHCRGTAAPYEHDVLANLVKLLAVAGTKAFPQTDKQKQRADAPGNPEHSQKRPELVRPEGAEGLAKDLEQKTHCR